MSSSYLPRTSSEDEDDSYYNYDFDTTYDDGSYAYGKYFNDTINLGGATVSSFTMGLVNETSRYIGVLGIGYNNSEYSNLPDRLQEQGLINSTAYSIWVDDEQASSGNLLFGAIDTTKFDGTLTRISSYYSDTMTINIAGINGTTSDSNGPINILDDDTDDSDYSSSTSSSDYMFTATFNPPDTVSNFPTDVASQIWAMAGAYYDSRLSLAIISCTAADDTTTNFSMQLGRGIYGPIITATMADLVIPAEDVQLSSLYEYYIDEDENLCLFGVQNRSTSAYYSYSSYGYSLGSSVLRRTYVVLDLVNGEIAVAPVKLGATATSNIVEFTAYGATVPSSIMHCIYSDCYETGGGSGGVDSDEESTSGKLPAGVLSVPALIGMSLGVGIGALLLGIIGFLIWRHRLNKNEAGKELPSVLGAEAGEAAPMMQPGSDARGAGAAPKMTRADISPVVAGTGTAPVDGEPAASAAPEASATHETGDFHSTGPALSSPGRAV